jgi:hypothetical protein
MDLSISLDSKLQPIPTYQDKDFNTSKCKIVKIGLKTRNENYTPA